MSNLDITFNVPAHIQDGLIAGQLERIGGVIRDSQSKQVVSWLRDAPTVANMSPEAVSHYSNLLASGKLKATAGSLASTASHALVSLQLINVALTAVSFMVVKQKMEKFDRKLDEIKQLISEEFRWDREVDERSALELADNAFEMQHEGDAKRAVEALFKAKSHRLGYFDKVMKDLKNPVSLDIAIYHLIGAMHLEMSRIRCFTLANNPKSLDFARKKLDDGLKEITPRVTGLVQIILQKDIYRFFHKDVTPYMWLQAISFKYWAYEKSGGSASWLAYLTETIEQVRADFWNQDSFKDGSDWISSAKNLPKNLISRKSSIALPEHNSRLTKSLSDAYVIIENYERLEGYGLELRSMRLSAHEWENLVDEKQLEENGFAIITDMDSDYMKRVSNLSQ